MSRSTLRALPRSRLHRRLSFEPLEGRNLLAVLTVNSSFDDTIPDDGLVTLREAIAAANSDGTTDLGHTGSGADTIQFAGGLTGAINFTSIGDTAAGPSALLVASEITIKGNANGITLQRDPGPVEMRLFYVAASGNLTLESIMLTGGVARGASGVPGENGGDGRGGAIYNEGTLQIIASTLYENRAIGGMPGAGGSGGRGFGGAIYNDEGTLVLRNATLSGNKALSSAESANNSAFGGGIYGRNGLLQIYNSTLTSSTAATGRGVYVFATGGGTATADIYSSIIAQQDAPSGSPDFAAVAETVDDELSISGADNLIRRTLNFSDAWNIDPLLGPLANSGGPTLTHALLSGSPAIDNGSNLLPLATDGRGAPYTRVIGSGADIGAFEVQQAAAPTLLGDYNADQVVDAADYVVWRHTFGDEGVERYSGADGSGDGNIDDADYNVWQEHFGASLTGGGGSGQARADAVASPMPTEVLTPALADVIEVAINTEAPSKISTTAFNSLVSRSLHHVTASRQGNSPALDRHPGYVFPTARTVTHPANDEALLAVLADFDRVARPQSRTGGASSACKPSTSQAVSPHESLKEFGKGHV